jgi:membrane fusion protein, multidrug efflux system
VSYRYRLALPSVLLLAAACTSRATPPPARVPVTVSRAERRAVPVQVTATGTVEPIQMVAVLPQVQGVVVGVRFREGDEVVAGQVLLELDARPYRAALQQAEAALARDLVQAENALQEANRYGALVESASVSREDYQQKKAAADAQVAAVRADSAAVAVARLNLEYATIRAPISGRTGGLTAREGNLVRPAAGAPLLTINQLRPILVRFAVPATELPVLLRPLPGKAARQVLVRGDRDSLQQVGDLAFIDNHVDSATGTVLLKGRFLNQHETLWPGEFVQVTLIEDVDSAATVVPAQAVVNGQQGTYVFVVSPDGRASQQAVTVSRTVDTLAVIASGIRPGTLVVTDGQLRLTPDARVEIRGGPAAERSLGVQP